MSGLGGAGAGSPPLAGVVCRVVNRAPMSAGAPGRGFWFDVLLDRGGLLLLLVGSGNFDCDVQKHFTV